MPYKVIYNDIINFNGDAIVNSLGIEGACYGAICKNIISSANDEKLKSYIDSLHNQEEGTIYVTEAGQLSCKHIIHLVTPFKYNDDVNNTNLKNAIRSVINMACQLDFSKIAIPFIGTGANGYSKDDALDSLMEICSEIEEAEGKNKKQIIDLYVIAYRKSEKELYKTPIDDRQYIKFYDELKIPNSSEMIDVINFMSDINEEELIEISPIDYKYPFDFVEDYIAYYDIDDRKLMVKRGIDKRRKGQYKKTKNLKMIDMLRIAVCLEMTKTHFVQFLIYSGKSLSPKSDIDRFVMDYYNGYYEKKIYVWELDSLLNEEGIDALDSYM